ncbi:hypothetical protein [Marinicella rhabdoformis]|uniref:hypothetical protein n=1 Tax=Marinicella rhabdoformis TaxID=2580566 RepID=UPI0012AEBFC7|nr:hypothetical protein [Marinicella rhabdoformis]
MLSYISNSEPSDNVAWGKSWLLLVVALLIFFGLYELWLKAQGHEASVVSDQDLWSYYRKKAQDNPDALVILGASRAQLGLHSETIRKTMPEKDVFQLTINGQYPMATFESLANDESFVGEVWVSLVAQSLEPVYWDMQKPNNRYFEDEATWDKSTNAYLSSWLQSKFRFLHPELNGQILVQKVQKTGAFPKPFYVKEHLDLSKSGDYSDLNKDEMVKHFVKQKKQNYQDQPPMDSSTWSNQVDKMKRLSHKITSRGGRVLLIRMPTDKGHWALDEQYYPKSTYWDVIEKYEGWQSVHFKDYVLLDSFVLPDSSHLDAKDAPFFTASLLNMVNGL